MPSLDTVSIFIVNEDPSCPSTTVENQVSFTACSETYIVRISAQSNAAGPFSIYTGATSGTPVYSAVTRVNMVAGQSLLLYNADQTGCVTPTPTPTQTVTPTPSVTASLTPTPTTSAGSPTPTPTPTITPTPSITPTNTVTPTVTATPSVTPSVSPSLTPSVTPSVTATPSVTPSVTATPSVTPSITPTSSITPTPSITPTITPTSSITPTPSITPTNTVTPTNTITPTPSVTPSITPTSSITPTPSITPTLTPSITPTSSITPTPSITPTLTPTITPTNTVTPSITPTITPTASVTPSITPTSSLTPTPSITPSLTPSLTPTITPTASVTPSITPTLTPTNTPTPSITPTITPSAPALQALIFMESTDDALYTGPDDTDIGSYMLNNSTQNWLGFTSTLLPDLTVANELSDFLTWMDWPGFVTGTTNVPAVKLATVPQSGGGTDSYGNSIEAYKFETTEIAAGTTTGEVFYTVLVPTAMTNGDIYSQIGISFTNTPNALTNTSTDSGLRSVDVVYTGSNWPQTTYRVYTASINNGFNSGAPGVTDATNNYFRGSTLI